MVGVWMYVPSTVNRKIRQDYFNKLCINTGDFYLPSLPNFIGL